MVDKRSSQVALMLAVVTASIAGCTAWGGDAGGGPLSLFIDPMKLKQPHEVAREMINPTTDPDVRRQAVEVVSAAKWGGAEPYLHAYRLLVTHPDKSIRAASLRALGRHGEPQDAEEIANYLDENEYVTFVRWEAAKALQKIHNPKVAKALIASATNDSDPDVRMGTTKALGQYPDSAVFQALVGLVNDPDFGVAYTASRSLSTLTGQDLGLAPAKWLKWGDEHANDLFADQQQYTWQPYDRPLNLLDKAQFWKTHEPANPRPPTGLADTGTPSEAPTQ